MKKEVIEVERYEIGDLLDIKNCEFRNGKGKQSIKNEEKCLVLNARKLATQDYSYKVLTKEGKTFVLNSRESAGAKYIGNIDLSMFIE